MKKDIYIIKNSVNNKVYIGQSKDAAKRWLHHIYDAKYENKYDNIKQPIHLAMKEIGYEKFHYEILESQVDNPDEREKYWIKYYDSIIPNGYNKAIGGKGVGAGTDSIVAIFKTKEELDKCIEEISSSNKSFENIGKKFGCAQEVISAINLGKRYRIDGMTYPLRNTRYSNELLKQICYSLKYELELTYKDICKKYNIDYSQLSLINQGKIHFIASEKYPLRKKRLKDLDQETVKKVIKDIKESELSMQDIAKKNNLTNMQVSNINNGKAYKQEDIIYPIRNENDPRNNCKKKFLDRTIVLKIIEDLKGKESMKKIASKYDISSSMVGYINKGEVKRYKIDGINYPVRPLK